MVTRHGQAVRQIDDKTLGVVFILMERFAHADYKAKRPASG